MHPSIKTPKEMEIYKQILLSQNMQLMYEFGYINGKAEMATKGLEQLKEMVITQPHDNP